MILSFFVPSKLIDLIVNFGNPWYLLCSVPGIGGDAFDT